MLQLLLGVTVDGLMISVRLLVVYHSCRCKMSVVMLLSAMKHHVTWLRRRRLVRQWSVQAAYLLLL